MTESVSGSSLLQARGDTTHSTSHEHSHNHHIRSHHKRLHHQHQQTHLEKKEDRPAEDSDSSVVHIVQTVDVIQVVDASGATVSLKTAAAPHPPPPPAPTTSASPNALSALPDHKVAIATPTDDDAAADQSYTPVPTPTPSLEPDTSASLSMSPSFPTVESYAKITSTPLPSGSTSGTFPSFSGATRNITSIATTTPTTQSIISSTPSPTSLLSNGTATTNGTIVTLKPILETNLTTSTLPNSSGTVLFNASFTTTLQSSDYVTSTIASSTVAPIATEASSSVHATSTNSDDGGFVGIFDGDGSSGGDSTAESVPSPSPTLPPSDDAGSESSGSGEGGKPTSPGTVAGSVIGSVAGVAFLLVLALMLLRWKKRQNALKLRDSGAGPGGLITGAASTGAASTVAASAGGKDNPFADPRRPATASTAVTAMSQRRSTPFAIPAALANLTGSQRRYSDRTDAASVEGGERGFQKVSGRKLPSVLHYGGDGYSEPGNRDTVMSDQSSYYRDSIGIFSGPGMPRLALGSPMRPESGVPVFHEGPARKAQTETGHFSGSNLEPPGRDPLGRSHPSQDGSNRTHGSASRFTEEI